MDESAGRLARVVAFALILSVALLGGAIQVYLKVRFGRTSLLSLSPRVVSGENYLIAKTHRLVTWLTLGLCGRTVIVDRVKQIVSIRSRWLWLFPRVKTVQFKAIEAILYGYADWNPFTALGRTGDTFDVFTVKLQFYNGTQLHLFNFFGEGTFEIGPATLECLQWTFWWRRLVDLTGTQEEDSRAFVNRLSKVIGVEVRRA